MRFILISFNVPISFKKSIRKYVGHTLTNHIYFMITKDDTIHIFQIDDMIANHIIANHININITQNSPTSKQTMKS